MSHPMKDEIQADVRSILSSGGYVYRGDGVYERVKEQPVAPPPIPVKRKSFIARLIERLTKSVSASDTEGE